MSGRGWVLAAAAGVLVWLGFAGVGWWPLALVAFIPLFGALDAATRGGRAVGVGLVCGTVAWGGAASWLVATLRDFGGLPWPAALAIALVVWVWHGGLLATFAWLWWRARRRGAGAAVAAAAAFATAEHLYPQIFPGYYAGSFHRFPLVFQIADLGGPLPIGALCLAVNGALYDLRTGRGRGAAIVVAGCVAAVLGYGAVRIAQVDAASHAAPRLHVGVVQPDMGAHAKWADVREGRRRLVDGTARLAGADLVVWPESAWPPGLPADATRVPDAVTGASHPPLLLGTVGRDGAGRVTNRVVLVDADGAVLGTYDKVNLLLGGERLPFETYLPWLRARLPTPDRFTPGADVRPLRFRAWQVAPLVCYEDLLPGFVRRVVAEGSPHLLVNLTNDVWFGDSQEPRIHLALATLRAVEQRRALVRATNTGISAVIDPVGRVVAQAAPFTETTLDASVPLLDGRTVYERLGDWPGWLAVAAIGWLAFARRPMA